MAPSAKSTAPQGVVRTVCLERLPGSPLQMEPGGYSLKHPSSPGATGAPPNRQLLAPLVHSTRQPSSPVVACATSMPTSATSGPPLQSIISRTVAVIPRQPLTPPRCSSELQSGGAVQLQTFGTPRSRCSNELRVGATVQLGGKATIIKRFLGEGSFGRVWAAAQPSATCANEHAVKEIFCRSSFELKNVEREAQMLKEFGDEGLSIPSLYGLEVERLDAGNGPFGLWRARLAMSYVPGQTLLDALDCARLPAEPTGTSSGYRIADACRFARELIRQLAPIMQRSAEQVFHRDAHARNIIVDDRGRADMPHFALIDFGLAVEAEQWRHVGWKSRGVAGDSRYWPVSGWVMFESDTAGLKTNDVFRQEYESQLDFHSIGLTALQLFSTLSALPQDPAESLTTATDREAPESATTATMLAIGKLQASWQAYWDYTTTLWQTITIAHAQHGHAEDVKENFAKLGVHATIGKHLKALHYVVRELREAYAETLDDERPVGIVGLLDSFLLMISTGEVPPVTASWAMVQSCVAVGQSVSSSEEQARNASVDAQPIFVCHGSAKVEDQGV